jgi:multiple sugar transport system substrate-binding protein
MQLPLVQNRRRALAFRRRARVFCSVIAATLLLAGAGCRGGTVDPAEQPKGFAGVSLTVRCSDPAFGAAVAPALQSWATRTGATIALAPGAMTPGDDTDVGILPASRFGVWADRGELARVPSALRLPDHPYQWTGVLPIYREQLSEWGGQAQAIPLAGDGHVIVYRTDRLENEKFVAAFNQAFGKKPRAPASWEEFADLAVQLAATSGKPSLPPVTGAELADWFFRVAACYDRPGMTSATGVREGSFSLQFDVATGAPRLDAPGFAAAGELFERLAKGNCFPPLVAEARDPAAAVAGDASLAVLSLAQLARLPREEGAVPARFGLAPLPGTRRYHDPGKGMVAAAEPNYVPYFSGGRLGVVRTRCASPDAAFDLLAELGGPARSLEVVSTPGLGAGPFRLAHLERDRLHVWYGYGLDARRTRELLQAMQQYVRQESKTPALGLRGPDHDALSAAAAAELGKLVSGTPAADVLRSLTAAWNEIDAKTPRETRLRWRKMAAGAG